jgi:hypothetical protein
MTVALSDIRRSIRYLSDGLTKLIPMSPKFVILTLLVALCASAGNGQSAESEVMDRDNNELGTS